MNYLQICSSLLKYTIHDIFTQMVKLPLDIGYLSLGAVYMDGTKIELLNNRYAFVWRKSVEKQS